MNFAFIVFALLAMSGGLMAADRCPANRKQQADACAKEMFFLMDLNFKILSKEDLPAHCKKIDDGIQCVNQYGKDCLKGFTRQTLTVGLHGMKKHYRSICGKTAPKADEFIKRTQWLSKDNVDEMYTCASGAIKNLVHIADKVRSDEQIPQACCSYWLSRRCMTTKMKKLTDEDNRKFLEDMSDEAMAGMIDFLCSQQKSAAVCKEKMPEVVERMDSVFNKVKKGDRNEKESYLIPFLDVVSEDKQ